MPAAAQLSLLVLDSVGNYYPQDLLTLEDSPVPEQSPPHADRARKAARQISEAAEQIALYGTTADAELVRQVQMFAIRLRDEADGGSAPNGQARCPHCGTPYELALSLEPHTGPVLRVCPSCGRRGST